MNHCQINNVFAAVGQSLVVFTEPSVPVQPGEGSFHNPPLGQNCESRHVVTAFDDLQHPPAQVSRPFNQLPGVTSVGPDQFQSRETSPQLFEYQLGSIPILHIGGVNHHRKDQPQRIHHQMAFSALYLLAGVIAPRPPFSTVLTDWLSMIAAEGVGFRPSWRRTCRRRAS